MNLYFKPITSENRTQIEKLQILPEQNGFVESVHDCLDEASKRECWRPVGIYDGDTLVGFAMYGFFWQYYPFGRVWLDRLLIDYRYQKMGYGRAALSGLLERLHREYRRKKVYLSVVDGNNNAIHLYQEMGFRFNGELDIHGEKVMIYTFSRSSSRP